MKKTLVEMDVHNLFFVIWLECKRSYDENAPKCLVECSLT